MYETTHNGIKYQFCDDHLSLNGNIIRYEMMDDIKHRGGDSPAFVFRYNEKQFALPYPPDELPHILPYMKTASLISPDADLGAPSAPADVPHPAPDPVPPAAPKKRKRVGCFVALLVVVILAVVGCIATGGSGTHVDGIEEEIVTSSFSDDVTGSWRVCTISESADPEEYALSYYENCFADDDTLHWIVNFGTNTTTSILAQGDMLTVTTHEYVDGEEHSAKEIGGGMTLGEFTVDIGTGEITVLQ